VLHDPVYRDQYAQNLKREFPRIPFYADFWQWADWGAQLMALHIGFESVAPWPLQRIDQPDTKARAAGQAPKALLRAEPQSGGDTGSITLDTETTPRGIPAQAWDYTLGNHSALDWVLDQHKEKSPKTPPSAPSSTPIDFPKFVTVRTPPHPNPPHAWGGGASSPTAWGRLGGGSFVRRFASVAHSGNLNIR